MNPKTLDEARNKRYKFWELDPEGSPYVDTRCAYEINHYAGLRYQCQRKNGHGINGLYCKQHAKMVR